MKKLNIKWLTAVALTLCLTAGVGSAMAYFTDKTSAQGGQVITLDVPWTPDEKPGQNGKDKIISITNTGDGVNVPIYARVFVYPTGENVIDGVDVTVDYNKSDWKQDEDGYFYYTKVLNKGESTSPLNVKVDAKGATQQEADKRLDQFDILVSEEATMYVEYDSGKENNASYEGWKNDKYDTDVAYKGGKN